MKTKKLMKFPVTIIMKDSFAEQQIIIHENGDMEFLCGNPFAKGEVCPHCGHYFAGANREWIEMHKKKQKCKQRNIKKAAGWRLAYEWEISDRRLNNILKALYENKEQK